MNSKQENKFSMAKSVLQTLESNTTVVGSLAALATAKTELNSVVSEIDTLTQAQAQKTSAAEKTLAGKTAVAIAMEVISAAKAYALDKEKPAIAASFNYSRRELEKMRDTVLVNTLKLVKDNATLLVADLTNYGADAAKLTELQAATDAYEALLTTPRTNIAARSTATKAIGAAFKKLDVVMEKVDKMIETRRNSHKDFYTNYKEIRKIVDNKGGGKGKDKKNDENTPTPPVS